MQHHLCHTSAMKNQYVDGLSLHINTHYFFKNFLSGNLKLTKHCSVLDKSIKQLHERYEKNSQSIIRFLDEDYLHYLRCVYWPSFTLKASLAMALSQRLNVNSGLVGATLAFKYLSIYYYNLEQSNSTLFNKIINSQENNFKNNSLNNLLINNLHQFDLPPESYQALIHSEKYLKLSSSPQRIDHELGHIVALSTMISQLILSDEPFVNSLLKLQSLEQKKILSAAIVDAIELCYHYANNMKVKCVDGSRLLEFKHSINAPPSSVLH